jgi:hypothetical protein
MSIKSNISKNSGIARALTDAYHFVIDNTLNLLLSIHDDEAIYDADMPDLSEADIAVRLQIYERVIAQYKKPNIAEIFKTYRYIKGNTRVTNKVAIKVLELLLKSGQGNYGATKETELFQCWFYHEHILKNIEVESISYKYDEEELDAPEIVIVGKGEKYLPFIQIDGDVEDRVTFFLRGKGINWNYYYDVNTDDYFDANVLSNLCNLGAKYKIKSTEVFKVSNLANEKDIEFALSVESTTKQLIYGVFDDYFRGNTSKEDTLSFINTLPKRCFHLDFTSAYFELSEERFYDIPDEVLEKRKSELKMPENNYIKKVYNRYLDTLLT